MDGTGVSQLFQKPTNSCFDYDRCTFQFTPCYEHHYNYRYNDDSAAWVLISAIIVFFMKAGFLLIELAFAQNLRDKRHVVVVKHLDVFASAFGFFLLGFDVISRYESPQHIDRKFFGITDPVLWFFKFTFASNAATILGGCLVTNKYKLRLPAAFLSAFIISGIIHPAIAWFIWNDDYKGLSVYRFKHNNGTAAQCEDNRPFFHKMYILDFAGGGAVHMLGGVAGLVLCLFAKLHNYRDEKRNHLDRHRTVRQEESEGLVVREERETVMKRDFWEWMYPVDGGDETTSEAALGVLILWFCWFAFNCGSTESIESNPYEPIPFHSIPAIIAVNMILAAASGGVISVLIASWAQIRAQSDSVNANEIANGVLSALVAITAGCPFVEYWAACLIGAIAIIVYHVGCWLEYKLGIEDTARVVPVHGLCGLWSLLAVGIFLVTQEANCTLHATFEGLCFSRLILPHLSYGERLASQIIGALLMIGITLIGSVMMYGLLYLIPMRSHLNSESKFAIRYNKVVSWIFKKLFKRNTVTFEGNWLFTGPGEIPHSDDRILRNMVRHVNRADTSSEGSVYRNVDVAMHPNYGATHETLGTVETANSSQETESTLSTIPSNTYTGTRQFTNTNTIMLTANEDFQN